ncbi:N-acetylmuramoyl-L-alanine amidase [Psychrobacillus sp. FSL K6-4046]|uniref:N-acetylmuramoyl-L-alanine amidase n=1 Tax=Psychrobacillus sp. FSL K6-4046 TaxID=2921550 RepID=UPI003159C5E1
MGLQGYKVFIDAGHGGTDPGTSYEDLKEKTLTLEIAKKLETELKSLGATTKMSRTTDVYPSLDTRIAESNKFGADIFCSVHVNAGNGTGVETWVHDNSSSLTNSLATYVNNAMATTLGVGNRGVKKAPSQRENDNIKVIDPKLINGWAILPEVLFIKTDYDKLKQSSVREQAAKAIARGMFNFSNSIPPKN